MSTVIVSIWSLVMGSPDSSAAIQLMEACGDLASWGAMSYSCQSLRLLEVLGPSEPQGMGQLQDLAHSPPHSGPPVWEPGGSPLCNWDQGCLVLNPSAHLSVRVWHQAALGQGQNQPLPNCWDRAGGNSGSKTWLPHTLSLDDVECTGGNRGVSPIPNCTHWF